VVKKRVHPAVPLKNLIAVDVKRFYPFCLRAQISLPYKRMWRASALYTFIVENFWSKVGLRVLFIISACVCVVCVCMVCVWCVLCVCLVCVYGVCVWYVVCVCVVCVVSVVCVVCCVCGVCVPSTMCLQT
jgi:hypothetical protein